MKTCLVDLPNQRTFKLSDETSFKQCSRPIHPADVEAVHKHIQELLDTGDISSHLFHLQLWWSEKRMVPSDSALITPQAQSADDKGCILTSQA